MIRPLLALAILVIALSILSNCTFVKRKAEPPPTNKVELEINPKVGCRDSNAATVMKSQFELVGYIVDKTKVNGRHGTEGEIYLTVQGEEELEKLTSEARMVVWSFANLNEWHSFNIYINLDNFLRRKIILNVGSDFRIICDFNRDGSYHCD